MVRLVVPHSNAYFFLSFTDLIINYFFLFCSTKVTLE